MQLLLKKIAFNFEPVAVIYYERFLESWNGQLRMKDMLPVKFIHPSRDTPTEADAKAVIEKYSRMKI